MSVLRRMAKRASRIFSRLDTSLQKAIVICRQIRQKHGVGAVPFGSLRRRNFFVMDGFAERPF